MKRLLHLFYSTSFHPFPLNVLAWSCKCFGGGQYLLKTRGWRLDGAQVVLCVVWERLGELGSLGPLGDWTLLEADLAPADRLEWLHT